jgi:hypothetical protein
VPTFQPSNAPNSPCAAKPATVLTFQPSNVPSINSWLSFPPICTQMRTYVLYWIA